MNTTLETAVRLIASPGAWMEGEALRQFYACANLDGVRQAVGFPDLHPGKRVPVGAAFVTEGLIYPHLIGGDIGCGMTLWQTDLPRRRAKSERWAELPFSLETRWEGNLGGWLQDNQLPSSPFDASMGTLGGGNHFAELQAVEDVHDAGAFAKTGLNKADLALLVHSGSRGYGESICRAHMAEHVTDGMDPESAAGEAYRAEHDLALRWAQASRELIARRFLEALDADGGPAWDGCHNSVTPVEANGGTLWIHRRGAVTAGGTPLVIPGSRGALSYLVKPAGHEASHAWSLAHGAGRKWARSETRLRVRERFRATELMQTSLGSHVICGDRDLLYEEAPMAYKPVESVIEALLNAGLIQVIATLRPVLTYKTRGLRR
ncbi:MAG: RNA ligase RtcB family protein [Verrucomicrobiales bacterium]|nr:RNA ligase RtcB family protein [Verrucomicrobiales bacterium]